MTTILARPDRILMAVGLLLLVIVSGAAVAEDSEEKLRSINWVGYNEALATGRDFDKPVFLHFTADP